MPITDEVLRRSGVERGEPLPSYAWPGGYPLEYTNDNGDTLCPKCADMHEEYGDTIVGVEAYMEGPPISCDNCGEITESAYGDPDEDKEEGMTRRIVAACMCEGCPDHEGSCWNTHDGAQHSRLCPTCAPLPTLASNDIAAKGFLGEQYRRTIRDSKGASHG